MLITICPLIFFLLFSIKRDYKQGFLRGRFFVRLPCLYGKSPGTQGAVGPHRPMLPFGQPCRERAGQEHPESFRESLTVPGPYRKQNRKEELPPEILRSVRILFGENSQKNTQTPQSACFLFFTDRIITAGASTNLLSAPPPGKKEEQTECTGKNARCRGSFSGHSDW